MKTFNKFAAQGDVMFVKINELPAQGLKPIDPEDGKIIVAHSETGHHHAFNVPPGGPSVVQLFGSEDPMTSYIRVTEPSKLEHLRSFDTHEPLLFDAGIYEVRRQREYTPEGDKIVTD